MLIVSQGMLRYIDNERIIICAGYDASNDTSIGNVVIPLSAVRSVRCLKF
jgi:hypothetical protein